jgi:hypothetical protein
MFQEKESLKNALDGSISRLGILEEGFSRLGKAFGDFLDPKRIIIDAQYIASSTVEMTRTVLGQGREIGMELAKTMASAREETLKFGVSNEENIKLYGAINTLLQNTRYLTSEQIVDMQALATIAGITAEEMSKFVVNFDTLGVGTDKAISHISELQGEARSLGLNVGLFMKNVGDNIKLMASYNFKGGVDGLSKMVAQATSLRINMSKTVSFAEKLMDPTKAIEVAAGFQMIGGAIGKLGQPLQLLNMAQTDMGAIQDELVKMTAAAVTFNEEGDFDIPVVELYRLRAVAEQTGFEFQELTEMALNSAKKTKKLTFLDGLANIPEEQKEMIANLGELKGGRLQISIPGVDKMKDVAELTGDDIKKLSSLQENMGRTEQEIAVRSMTALEAMALEIASIAAKPEAAVLRSGQFEKVTESMATSVNRFVTAVENEVKNRNLGQGIDTQSKILIPELSEENAKNLAGGLMAMADNVIKSLPDGLKNAMKDVFGNIDTVTITGDRVLLNVQDRSNESEYQNRSTNIRSETTNIEADSINITAPAIQQSSPQPPVSTQPSSSTITPKSSNNSITKTPVEANLNVNGTVTLNLEGTNANFTKVDFNRLAQNNPELIAMIQKAVFNLNNQYDTSISIS